MKNNGKHKRRYYNTLFPRVCSLMLYTYMHRLEMNIARVFWPKISWYGQNSKWVNSIFSNEKCFAQFIHELLKR